MHNIYFNKVYYKECYNTYGTTEYYGKDTKVEVSFTENLPNNNTDCSRYDRDDTGVL